MKTFLRFLVGAIPLAAFLLLAACATQVPGTVQPHAAGFLEGLVQGVVAPFAFIVSLFQKGITVYAVPNNGAWYNFGFVLGIGGFSITASQGRRRRNH